MQSRRAAAFKRAFDQLPPSVQDTARRAYALWKADPGHRSLDFKKLQGTENIYSARIGLSWRALGAVRENRIVWFWIGSHSEYDRLVRNL
jgi:hypothetical protein